MKYSEGTTLDKYLKVNKAQIKSTTPFELLRGRRSKVKLEPRSENEIRPIFTSIVKALIYLHEIANVCHRDIKMTNILVEKKGKVRLIDFGFSTVVDYSVDGHGGKPMVTRICGTPCFMSPELTKMDMSVEGRRDFYDGKAVDVWALGVCLYKMLTGIFPFGSNIFTFFF